MRTVHVKSPGRINIIGEHTDYNNGYVLPAAISRYTIIRASVNDADYILLNSLSSGQAAKIDLNDITKHHYKWVNYVLGAILELKSLNKEISGFSAYIAGNIPQGAGLSSSASFLCTLVTAINQLFELELSKIQMAKICQNAEYHYIGTKCGIMDQMAVLFSKENNAMLIDCENYEKQYIPIDIPNYSFLLLDTGIKHSLADTEYNKRRKQCETAMEEIKTIFPGINNFRDIDSNQLKELETKLPISLYEIVSFITNENNRVLKMVNYIYNNKIKEMGELLYESHYGLKNDYKVSCGELDYLVKLASRKKEVAGARMMGGGFGGCTLNLVKNDYIDNFIEIAKSDYYEKFNIMLKSYKVSLSKGTLIL